MGEIDYTALFAALPTAYLALNPDLTVAAANGAFLALVGRTSEELLGVPLFEAFPPTPDALDGDGRPHIQVSLEQVRDTGKPETMPLQSYAIADGHGGLVERHWSLIHVPVLAADGSTALLLQRAEDVTDYVRESRGRAAEQQRGQQRLQEVEADLFSRADELSRALAARDATARRLAGLTEAAMQLSGARTVRQLTEIIGGSALAGLGAHSGALVVGDGSGPLHVTVAGGLLRVTPATLTELDRASPMPAAVVIRTGQPLLLPDRAAGLAVSPEMAQVYEATGDLAWAALPLRIGDRVLGALVASWQHEREFPEDEVDLLAAFAAQCAQALDRLQVRDAERRAARSVRRLAESLQRSLLTAPPQPDHLVIAVRYQPAARDAKVGGDWYDAFVTPDGTTTLVVGDVTGHDRNAAATMGQMRNVLRGVAQTLEQPPAAILTAFDRALRSLAVEGLATALLCQVTQSPEQRTRGERSLRWSNAGHPPPVVVRPGSAAVLLAREPDLLLGLSPETARADHEIDLPDGGTLVLYSDGLVERRGEPLDAGLDRLRAAVERRCNLQAEELADALLAELVSDPEDDVALVVVRLHPQD